MTVSLRRSAHDNLVHSRRVRKLAEHLAPLLPQGASVLDVGCGDGLLAQRLSVARPDISIRGVEVMVRPDALIPVEAFDGTSLLMEDASVDVVMMVDVLHHTEDPLVLLTEAKRVARHGVLLKDHCLKGIASGVTLRFMDWMGNAHHLVALPYNYLTQRQWDAAFAQLGIAPAHWQTKLQLYPLPFDWVFGRSLHFVGLLKPEQPA